MRRVSPSSERHAPRIYNSSVIVRFDVLWHPGAVGECDGLPVTERVAIAAAVEKLEIFGAGLPFPHSSKVHGSGDLRELRPRGGRCAWRVLYRQVAKESFVVAAIAPDSRTDRRGFARAARRALERLDEIDMSDEGEEA